MCIRDRKQANYEAFQNSEENTKLALIYKYKMDKSHELADLGNGTDDIIDDWQMILDAVFKLVEVLKVPGRKAKGK